MLRAWRVRCVRCVRYIRSLTGPANFLAMMVPTPPTSKPSQMRDSFIEANPGFSKKRVGEEIRKMSEFKLIEVSTLLY